MIRAPRAGVPVGPLLVSLAVTLPAFPAAARAQAPAAPRQHPTPAERADYLAFTAAEEVEPYLATLAANDAGVELHRIGRDPALPVLRIGPAGGGEASAVRVLVIGAQHGDERAGLEVALALARDLVAGPLARLRTALDVRVVPMANPTGVAARRRTNPAGVDLAADHLRLRSAEARALWREFRDWRPHVVLDLHELGPSEYTVQIAVPTHPNVHPSIRELARFYLLPHAANALARADVRFHEYVSPWHHGETAEAAAVPAAEGNAWFSPPATDPYLARNAFALAGGVGLFVAASSSRDILGLGERVGRLRVAAAALLEAAAGLKEVLLPAVAAADGPPAASLAVRHHYESKGPDAALPWIFINERGQRESGELAPWRAELVVDSSAAMPLGWWLDPGAEALLDAVRAHGFSTAEAAPARALAERPREDAIWIAAPARDARLLFTMIESAGLPSDVAHRVPE